MASSSFFWRCFVFLATFRDCLKFHVNTLTGSGNMTIFFIRAWPEIRKLENLKKFCPIFGDCEELRIPNVTLMFLIKCYWILQNETAFTISELLREKQEWRVKIPAHLLRLGLYQYIKYFYQYIKYIILSKTLSFISTFLIRFYNFLLIKLKFWYMLLSKKISVLNVKWHVYNTIPQVDKSAG